MEQVERHGVNSIYCPPLPPKVAQPLISFSHKVRQVWMHFNVFVFFCVSCLMIWIISVWQVWKIKQEAANSFSALYAFSFTFKNSPTWFWRLCEWMCNSWQQPFVSEASMGSDDNMLHFDEQISWIYTAYVDSVNMAYWNHKFKNLFIVDLFMSTFTNHKLCKLKKLCLWWSQDRLLNCWQSHSFKVWRTSKMLSKGS